LRPIDDSPLRLLAVGNLQPRKNLIRLLSTVRRIATIRPVYLRVVGPDGYQAARIRAMLSQSAEVDVVGYVAEDDLVDEYRRADIFVYPSIYEGFGLPVLEAMACGVPVVTTTGGALPEVAGDAALLVDPLDEVAMANAILSIADDLALRRSLQLKGLARARLFSWSDAASRLIDVYRSAIG
jgi:glycosyltransferase involved in cell wall biosynthesis